MHGPRGVVFPLVAGLFGIALSGVFAGQAVPLRPPAAPVRPVTDTLHGVAVTDPYRWMEDGGQEFTDWLKAQDAYTRAVLGRIPGRAKIAAELRALATQRAVKITLPRRVGNRYFYRKRNFTAEEQGPKLYVRDATTGTERLLVDPVAIQNGDQPWTIQEYAVSPDGRYVAYIATPGGTDVGTLRVMEVATARTLTDTIDRVFYLGRLFWRPDSRAFTFTRLRALRPGASAEDAQKCPTVFLHVVGTGADSDRPLIGCGVTPRIPIAEHQLAGVSFSTASPYALAWVQVDRARTALDFYTAPVDTLSALDVPWRRLASGNDEVTEVILRGNTAYLRTGHGAPRGKVVRTSVLHPDLAHADVVVAQSDAVIATLEPVQFQSALYLAKDALYVRMRDAGIGRLMRVPFDRSGGTAVPLPFAGSVRQAAARPEDAGITFALQSWTRASRVYTFDPESGTVRDTGLVPNNPAERREFEVADVKARSADGTLVPLTIVAFAGLKKDSSHPTLLEGYGAVGQVTDPVFTPALIPWLERGGVSAQCHVRGGGDLGEEWHRAGQRRNKANTISDFIACAEYLVTQGYTTPARLAGMGASAGGLTIGGAINRRPDLFAVAFPVVAVSDLLRFGLGTNRPQLDHVQEYGTVTDPDDFRAMLAVSPYHNITPGTRYPAVFAMTAINDDRVPPWHVGKLVARLQAATTSDKPVLLRVDWTEGHYAGVPPADRYSFMLWQMGIPEFQPTSDK